jgi:hypothetical protein
LKGRFNIDKVPYLLAFVLALSAAVYIGIRCQTLCFTYDEATSYLNFVIEHRSLFKWLDGLSANNHPLNTWGMQLMNYLFGSSELSLRLPNFLAGIIYIIYSFKLLLHYFRGWTFLLLYGAFLFQPFVLDFFSLARGYGLSIGFLMISFYHGLRFLEKQDRPVHLIIGLAAALLSVISVLSMTLYFIAFAFTIAFFLLFNKELSLKLRLINYSIIAFFLLAGARYFVPLSFGLREAKALYYGGTEGFWGETVVSLLNTIHYGKYFPVPVSHGWLILVLLVMLFVLVDWIIRLSKREFRPDPAVFPFLILVAVAVGEWLMFHLFDSLFLMQRTALFLIPLSLCMFAMGINISWMKGMKAFVLSAAGFAICFILSYSALNFSYCNQWTENYATKKFVHAIKQDIELSGDPRMRKVEADFIFFPGVTYYNKISYLTNVEVIKSTDSSWTGDYFIARDSSSLKAGDKYKVLMYDGFLRQCLWVKTK